MVVRRENGPLVPHFLIFLSPGKLADFCDRSCGRPCMLKICWLEECMEGAFTCTSTGCVDGGKQQSGSVWEVNCNRGEEAAAPGWGPDVIISRSNVRVAL